MGEFNVLAGDEFVVIVVFRQHGSAHLLGQFDRMLHIVLWVGTGVDLIVIFEALKLHAVPKFI